MDEDRLKDTKRRMEGAVKALASEFQTVRTGRASTGLLDRVTVEAYGAPRSTSSRPSTPRSRGSSPCSRTTAASWPRSRRRSWSPTSVTPNNDGQIIRLPVPQLTEERRKEMVRLVHKMAEEARVAVRNVAATCSTS